MKARDIVPGWPRGRTTSSASTWLYIWWNRRNPYEELADMDYHVTQQAMATKFIEAGKPLDEKIIQEHLALWDSFRRKIEKVRK